MIIRKKFFKCSPWPAIAAAGAGAGAAAGSGAGAGAGAVASGISAGAAGLDVLGGQAFGIANLILQSRAYNEQREWQKYVYDDQKKLNDPAYIMERRRLAGLNPYGDFSGSMATGQPTPVSASGVGDALNGLAGSLSNSTSKAFQALSQRLAFKTLQLQEKKTDAEIKLTDNQIEQLKSTTAYQDLVNEIAEATKGYKIQLSELEVEKLLSDILLNDINAEWLPQRLQADIENLRASASKSSSEAALNKYNLEEYMPAMLLINKLNGISQRDLNESYKNLNEKSLGKIAEEIENLRISGAGVKELKKIIDGMPDGIGKTFMSALLIVLQSNLKK